MWEDFSLRGKTAVVIGGSRGIGKALALGLADAGANVIPTSRTEAKVKEVVKEIKSKGRRSLVYPIDVCKKEEVEKIKEKVVERFDGVEILINSAGTNVKKELLNLSEDEWDKILEVNLKGVFLASKIFGRHMVKKSYGKIINIASLGSFVGIKKSSAYCASKGGVNQLTKVLALEWAEHNVNVNAIAPGFFKTKMTEPVFKSKKGLKKIISNTPKKRTGEVEELIGATVFLASDAARFVTGETLRVDGGFLAHGI